MREIKFRAWDVEEKNWAKQPYPIAAQLSETAFGFDTENSRYILLQYTGLKDKRGKEIYEGDVVCYVVDEVVENIGGYDRTEPEGHLGKVDFANGAFWVNSEEFEFYMYGEQMFMWSELEVIGNIYEHPELLQDPISSNER